MARVVANVIYRLLFLAVMAAGLIGAIWVFQQLRPVQKPRRMPENLQKYLGQEYYPPAEEGVPKAKSGPSLEEAIRATGGDVEKSME